MATSRMRNDHHRARRDLRRRKMKLIRANSNLKKERTMNMKHFALLAGAALFASVTFAGQPGGARGGGGNKGGPPPGQDRSNNGRGNASVSSGNSDNSQECDKEDS